ncbi:conjugal transfer protein TraG [Gallibacterium anatis]|uniref:type IV conjugative transfer system coupling protein TraD n=1 Tax=Gallibacterium anatis TaxID=750 RepID=UPI0005313B23|nr:type IV conjugative transfer system coupling protein TraD [Gallibacterium anatis]KGQ45392.1 conjugal transfer protein TraG [Gallibacterium anatis]KGQ50718.1 conjugal transfer protein TraG [Gallibacterium anatis]KGQ58154.1 conjugal transfer protein TraG [Gallibacterium anatis]
MASKYLLEGLLRPPVEFYPAAAHAACAYVCAVAPWSLALNPMIGYGLAAGFGGLSYLRFRQGWRIVRYHRNLKRLPYYALTSRQIPVNKKFLFLGRGFEWQPEHTQRLYDCFSANGKKYLRPSKLFNHAREYEKHHDNFITKLTTSDSRFNPVRPLPPVEGIPAIHGIELNEIDVMQPLNSRGGHTAVFGTTGVGKTRFAEVLVTQDIHRGKTQAEREVVVFFDPKGDPDMLKRMYAEAKRAGRDKEFYMFHLGYPEKSARYNPIGRFGRVSEVAGRISGQLSGAGNSAAFKEFAWRFVNIVARALVEMGERPNYSQISRFVQNIDSLFLNYAKTYFDARDPEIWPQLLTIAANVDVKNLSFGMKDRPLIWVINQYILENKIFDPVLEGLATAVRYDKTYFDKIVASLLPLLEKLTTGKIEELLSPDYSDVNDERPIFDWEEVIRKRGIVYVGLDALSDATVAAAVGNSMFADLVSMAGHIYKHGVNEGLPEAFSTKNNTVKINLHCDEFNELMGDEFIPLINKGRGAGMQVTAYTQTIADIEARLGNRAKAEQTIGNFNTLIMFRVKSPATAKLLTDQLHKVTILQSMVTSSFTDSSNPSDDKAFTSNTGERISQKEVPLLDVANVTNLPKGQAFILMNGSTLYKVRMPLPALDKDDVIPDSMQELLEKMQKHYHIAVNWWEPAFKEYTPSKDIANSFEEMISEERIPKADVDWGGGIDMPEEDDSEPISQADTIDVTEDEE